MSTTKAQHFDSDSFKNAISNSSHPVLVDFHADWCPPCKVLGPTIDALANEYAGRAQVGKVDIDANKDLAREFNVRSIPTTLVFLDGEVVDRFVGIASKETLAQSLDSAADNAAA